MTDLRQRTLVSVRTNLDPLNPNTNVLDRLHCVEFGNPLCRDIAKPSLNGAASILGLFAADASGRFAFITAHRGQATRYREMTDRQELRKSELGGTSEFAEQAEPLEGIEL